MKRIKLGDWVEALIHVITFGFGTRIANLCNGRFYSVKIVVVVVKDISGCKD